MKKLLFGLTLLSSFTSFAQGTETPVSVYSCSMYPTPPTQNEVLTFPVTTFTRSCVELTDAGNYTFNDATYTSSSVNAKNIQASTSIHADATCHVGPFTGAKSMRWSISPKSPFDVAVMNYDQLDGIEKLKKFEIGIEMPTSIGTKVENFVNDANVASTEKINPYVDWELKVEATFTCLSDGLVYKVDGFYNREYSEWMVNPIPAFSGNSCYGPCYEALGGYQHVASSYPFRVRFAPPKIGVYNCKVKIISPSQTVESTDFTFNVIESDNKGYMTTSINGRYLEHDGHTFIPIGCNLTWPETLPVYDPELSDYIQIQWEPNLPFQLVNEGYRSVKPLPRVYDKFRQRTTSMVNNGANYFRFIMAASTSDIEFAEPGNYSKRLFIAQEMDEILEQAEENDFFIQWNMSIHGTFIPDYYFRSGTWTNSSFDGEHNGYADLTGITQPFDFFTNTEAKNLYKQKIRYVLARWGYSTQISMFELMSEINQIGPNSGQLDVYADVNNTMYASNPEVIEAWHIEMSEYVKSIYNGKIHLLTGSYAGVPDKDDHTYENVNFDVIGINIYSDIYPRASAFQYSSYGKLLLNADADDISEGFGDYDDGTNTFEILGGKTKPMIIAETGFFDGSNFGCDDNLTEYRRMMWQDLFSGVAGSLQWSARFYPSLDPIYLQLKQFVADADFGDVGGLWRPGGSYSSYENGGDYWHRDNNAVEGADNEEEYRADAIYMVSQDKSRVIGVITNKTYNVYTSSPNSSSCEYFNFNGVNNIEDKEVLNRYVKPYSYGVNSSNDQSFAVDVQTYDLVYGLNGTNMKIGYVNNNEDYIINYYHHNNGVIFDGEILESDNSKIKPHFTVNGNAVDYIVPFKAQQTSSRMNTENPNTIGERPNELADVINGIDVLGTTLFPNPFTNVVTLISNEDTGFEIYDSKNQLVYSGFVKAGRNEINLSALSSGIYFLRIKSSGEFFKLIKQ